MNETTRTTREFRILEEIKRNPETTQATLAAELGVAVGTVNWHIKRLVRKGYVKVSQLQRRRLRYIITPSGIALRSRLTVSFLQNSMVVYRLIRQQAHEILSEVRQAGYDCVQIAGDGDLAEIVRLTCLEHGLDSETCGEGPTIRIEGLQLDLEK